MHRLLSVSANQKEAAAAVLKALILSQLIECVLACLHYAILMSNWTDPDWIHSGATVRTIIWTLVS